MVEEGDTGALTMTLTMEPVPMDHIMVHPTLPMEVMVVMEVDMVVSVCLYVSICLSVYVSVCVRACMCMSVHVYVSSAYSKHSLGAVSLATPVGMLGNMGEPNQFNVAHKPLCL